MELGDQIDEALAARARAIADAWEALGHGPAVPAYASAVLRFDPLALDLAGAERLARALLAGAGPAVAVARSRTVEIPTIYDGPDLAAVAEASSLTVAGLVALHASRAYRAHFLGFLPGFAYCGTLDPRIVAPRLARPRARVPAGSVAVAAGQTAVYPLDSPGGWRLIGRTRVRLYDPAADPPALLRAGDLVRFVPAAPPGGAAISHDPGLPASGAGGGSASTPRALPRRSRPAGASATCAAGSPPRVRLIHRPSRPRSRSRASRRTQPRSRSSVSRSPSPATTGGSSR